MRFASGLVRLGVVAVAALFAAGGFILDNVTSTSAAPTTYTAIAGGVGPGQAMFVNVFEPSTLIVTEGDSIQWKVNVDEPHTVTFLNGGPPKGITLDNIDAANVKSGVSYDGTNFIHSGFITPDPTSSYTIKFTKTGSFQFVCLIHPGMAGTVTVIAAGSVVPTQAQIDADGKAAQAKGAAAAQALLSKPAPQAAKSGTTWTIPSSPYSKLPDGFVAQNVFTPAKISIAAGDTVTWLNDTPQAHTVTLLDNAPPKGDPTQPTKVTSYTGGFASSGLIGTGGPPELFTGGAKYSLTFPNPGTYAYICILHSDQRMVGTVEVGPAGSAGGAAVAVPAAPTGGAPGAPAAVPALRPPATGDAGLASYSTAAWPLALIVALLGIGSMAAIKVRTQA